MSSNPVLSQPLAVSSPLQEHPLQQQQQQQQQPAPPNVDPYFRYLSFDDSFGQVFFIFRQRYRAFLTITFINYMVGWIVALIAAYLLGADLQIDGFSVSASTSMSSTTIYSFSNFSDYNTDDAGINNYNTNFGNDYYYDENGNWTQSTPGMQAWQIMFYYIECAIYYCFLCVAHGASVWLAAHLYLEQYPTLEDAYRQAAKQVCSLVTSLMLSGLIIVAPVFFLAIYIAIAAAYQSDTAIMFGILLAMSLAVWITFVQVVLYHVYPAIMVEKLGPVGAMERSYHLTSGQRCYIFAVLLCWALIRFMAGFVIVAISIVGYPYSWQWWLAKSLDTMCAILFASIESV